LLKNTGCNFSDQFGYLNNLCLYLSLAEDCPEGTDELLEVILEHLAKEGEGMVVREEEGIINRVE
jgi:hypothetical protein